MASVKKGVILFRGDTGRPQSNTSKSVILLADDDAKLATFCTSFEDHTLANISGRSFNIKTVMVDHPPTTGANIDIRGNIFMKDPTDDSMVKFSYPAPVEDDFEEVSEGTRMKLDSLEEIVGYLNTLTGRTVVDTALLGLYGTKTQTS